MNALEALAADVVNFVKDNQAWAPYIVAMLCFAESLAVISFFVPATVMLVGDRHQLPAVGREPSAETN